VTRLEVRLRAAIAQVLAEEGVGLVIDDTDGLVMREQTGLPGYPTIRLRWMAETPAHARNLWALRK
jgi:hypothetical protein